MFVFVKVLKVCFQSVTCNDKHGNVSYLDDFYPFSEPLNHLAIGPDKKVCKHAQMIAIDDL